MPCTMKIASVDAERCFIQLSWFAVPIWNVAIRPIRRSVNKIQPKRGLQGTNLALTSDLVERDVFLVPTVPCLPDTDEIVALLLPARPASIVKVWEPEGASLL